MLSDWWNGPEYLRVADCCFVFVLKRGVVLDVSSWQKKDWERTKVNCTNEHSDTESLLSLGKIGSTSLRDCLRLAPSSPQLWIHPCSKSTKSHPDLY